MCAVSEHPTGDQSSQHQGGAVFAIDIGGTFTDLVAYDTAAGVVTHAKSPTTPRDLVRGVLDCVAKSRLRLQDATEVIHGSTIAINTVLQRRGARSALLVTRGTRDVYAIGRGNRPDAYSLFFRRPRPLVPRRLTYEVPERIRASGAIDLELDEAAVRAIADALRAQEIEAVAVCFLHAYTNPAHERRVGEILRSKLPECYISLSHEIVREYREYERTSTTVVNSYVGPTVSGYVAALEERLGAGGFGGALWIMQSNGGVVSAGAAARKPVTMMESGPVGGITAAAEVGSALGCADVIAFDMGGTTAKASLIRDGLPVIADGYHIGGYAEGQPVISPVVDVVEVGTGGGSIAWIDEVGALKVGPVSAGAEPGPICYGRGGDRTTLTDANVALGRVRPEGFMGGEMALDVDRARLGIAQQVAHPLRLTPTAAAAGIIDIAIASMSLAVREVSVAKGFDPRDFVLVASGGAGPLHAVAVARELHIPTVVIPRFPAHFSAVGMLQSDQRHDAVQTVFARLDDIDVSRLRRVRNDAIDGLLASLSGGHGDARFDTVFDLRYAAQEFTLPIPVSEGELERGALEAIRRRFDEAHDHRHGHHAPDEAVELMNLRVQMVVPRSKPSPVEPLSASPAVPRESVAVHVGSGDVPQLTPVFDRDALTPGAQVAGPALIQEYASTTVLFPGDRCTVSPSLDLIVTVDSG